MATQKRKIKRKWAATVADLQVVGALLPSQWALAEDGGGTLVARTHDDSSYTLRYITGTALPGSFIDNGIAVQTANFNISGNGTIGGSLTLVNALLYSSGGTGFSTYNRGDLIYASAANTLSKLPIGSSTYVLTSDGIDLSWQAPSGGGGLPSLSGNAGKVLRVNTGESSAEWADITNSGSFGVELIGSVSGIIDTATCNWEIIGGMAFLEIAFMGGNVGTGIGNGISIKQTGGIPFPSYLDSFLDGANIQFNDIITNNGVASTTGTYFFNGSAGSRYIVVGDYNNSNVFDGAIGFQVKLTYKLL